MQDEIPNPGSTISLISSAQVRYEGVLETIQMRPDESSITLANGKRSCSCLLGTDYKDLTSKTSHTQLTFDIFNYRKFW